MPNSIKINQLNVIEVKGKTSFIPVGSPVKLKGAWDKIIQKKASPDDYWATLGRQDNGNLVDEWDGKIVCSNEGNNEYGDRGEEIRKEVELIRSLFPDENPDVSSITEKFISLDEVTFKTAASRKIRMTLMVKETQHALVFIQHTDPSDTKTTGGLFEYVVPESVADTGKRDRMTYLFEVPAESVSGPSRFVIKAITFKRNVEQMQSDAAVDQLLKGLDNTYNLNLFDAASGNFVPVDPSAIDRTKKTLVLIHGTFATIEGSYGDLRTNGWLKSVLAKGKYGQIIGFDHLTVFDSPKDNARVFFNMLQPGGAFTHTVDVITTSRGGLVGKCIINDKTQTIMKFERAATVACANGVEYISVGQNIGRFLSIAKRIAPEQAARLILGLLSQTVNYIITRKGLAVMGKDSDELKEILHVDSPANPELRYYPLCGDYSLRGEHPVEWKFVDILLTGLMKSPNHDWVVETDYQVIMPQAHYAYSQSGKNVTFYRGQPIDTTHTRYFFDAMTQVTKQRIFDYLHDTNSVL